MSPTLVTRLAALFLALVLASSIVAGGPANGQGNAPAALLLDSSAISPSVVGLAPDGSPADTTVTTTWLVRAIAGLTGQQHAGDDENQKHSFFLVQKLQVRDSTGTIIRTITTIPFAEIL